MRADTEAFLPIELLRRASLEGNEYAWPLVDIPRVIEAAREADLVNIGGQLQFRLPGGGVCECYWIEVDTYRDVDQSLPWPIRVRRTAEAALRQFSALPAETELVAEGRKAFGDHLSKAEAAGHAASALMCFVWYVLAEN